MPTASLPRQAPGARDDRELVAALRAGDEQAFHQLVDRHYSSMKRLALTYVHSEAVADEVVQETWLAVVTGIGRFDGRSALSTWLFSILSNRARTHATRERRVLPFSAVVAREDDESVVVADRFQGHDGPWPGHWATPPRPWQRPERRLLSLEARERLREALDQLPERQRIAVTLRDVEGLNADEA